MIGLPGGVGGRRDAGATAGVLVALALLAGTASPSKASISFLPAPAGDATAARSEAARVTGPLAAGSPFVSSDESRDSAPREAAGTTPSSARLDGIATELRRTPLVVDPEVGYVLDAAQRRSLVRTLGDARVAVFVAVLPRVDEDESGGDTERVLQTLQRRVGRPGIYVTVDEEGRMDLASVGVPLDLSIPYSLLFPPRDERAVEQQAADPAPPGWTTVPERLRTIVATVAKAGPGSPNEIIDDVDPLPPLSGSSRDARNREDAVAAGVTGTLLGLLVAGTFLGIRAAVRKPLVGAGGGGRGGPSGPRPGGGPRRSGRPSSGRRRKRGRRRGNGRA